MIKELFSDDKGISIPKKNPADTGQKEIAWMIPIKIKLIYCSNPDRGEILMRAFADLDDPNIPEITIPMIINNGPISVFPKYRNERAICGEKVAPTKNNNAIPMQPTIRPTIKSNPPKIILTD